jgi:SAM-dependent methyltransferase
MSHTRRDRILSLVQGTGLRVVDLGCANGSLGKRIRDQGNWVGGVELSREARVLARSVLDHVWEFDIQEEWPAELQRQDLDIVIASEVLEHVFDPVAVLRHARSALKQGGHIVITTPNFMTWTNRLKFLVGAFAYQHEGMFDFGNGISLIIFAGIVAQLPASFNQAYQLFSGNPNAVPTILGIVALVLIVIAGVVLVTEAQRNIPIAYAKRVRGNKLFGGVNTHLPLRLNQAGVIPIIFAISLMIFPALIAQFFINAKSAALANFAQTVINLFNSQQGWFYGITYFVLVMAFTYFYTAVVFNPQEIAENVQKTVGLYRGLDQALKPQISYPACLTALL